MQNNPFPYSNTEKRYHTLNYHLRDHFGHKVFKVALDGGFDCQTETAPLPTEAVLFAAPQAQVISPGTGPMI